jgi:retinol-binding protein 3
MNVSRFASATLAAMIAFAGVALAQPKPVSSAPMSPAATPAQNSDGVDAATRKEVTEALATALADGYVYADLGRKMANAVRARLKAGAYDKITSADAFAHALTADIRAIIDDKHLRVISRSPMMMTPTAGMMAMMHAMNAGIPRVEILEGNIGYVEVNGLPPLDAAKDTIATAFAFLHNTDALIIDARGNGGGDPNTVTFYMSYLSEGAPYVVNRLHFREGDRVEETKTTDLGALTYGAKKPVFFLTSRRTFSGGEELAYDLQAFKRATIVGETTGGGANPGDMKQLGHGFSMLLPNGYVANPVTGSNWEGVGVKPDIEVPAEQALTKAKLLAAQQLKRNAADPRQQATLEELALELSEQANGGPDLTPLSRVQLAGQYGGMGTASGPTVTDRNGELYIALNTPNTPEVRLIPLGGNHYRLAGYPDDFTAFFSATNGKVQLLASTGHGAAVMQKQ